MITSVLVVFFDLFVNAFDFILIIRIVMSWVVPDMQSNWLGRLVIDLTEPILAPVRKLLPQGGMIDFAPLVTIIALYALRTLVFSLIFH